MLATCAIFSSLYAWRSCLVIFPVSQCIHQLCLFLACYRFLYHFVACTLEFEDLDLFLSTELMMVIITSVIAWMLSIVQ